MVKAAVQSNVIVKAENDSQAYNTEIVLTQSQDIVSFQLIQVIM